MPPDDFLMTWFAFVLVIVLASTLLIKLGETVMLHYRRWRKFPSSRHRSKTWEPFVAPENKVYFREHPLLERGSAPLIQSSYKPPQRQHTATILAFDHSAQRRERLFGTAPRKGDKRCMLYKLTNYRRIRR